MLGDLYDFIFNAFSALRDAAVAAAPAGSGAVGRGMGQIFSVNFDL